MSYAVENANFLIKEQIVQTLSPPPDVSQLANLYAEFAEKDRQLAEEGLEEYSDGLVKEDTK